MAMSPVPLEASDTSPTWVESSMPTRLEAVRVLARISPCVWNTLPCTAVSRTSPPGAAALTSIRVRFKEPPLLPAVMSISGRTTIVTALETWKPCAVTPVRVRLRSVALATTLATEPRAGSAASLLRRPASTEAQSAVTPPEPTVTV